MCLLGLRTINIFLHYKLRTCWLICLDLDNYLIVLHELGVAKFDFSGRKLWSILTPDIAESAQMWNEETLIIRQQGPGKQLTVDVLTGRLRPLR